MLNDYQKESSNLFKTEPTLTVAQVQLLDWAMGLGGEAGEVLDVLKHSIFHQEAVLNKMELAKELGDVLWYVSAIATTCEIDLADVVSLNCAKLRHRYGNAYSVSASANRHEKEQELKSTTQYKCLQARILNTKSAPVSVFVVGPDGSGKTTFTLQLAERLGFERVKCDYRQEDKPTLANAYLSTKQDVIYDRFYYPDDLIYSKLKKIPLDESYKKDYIGVLANMKICNPIILYIDANLSTLVERSVAWADDYVQTNQLEEIKMLYAAWLNDMRAQNIPVVEIDTSLVPLHSSSYDKLVQFVVDEIGEYKVHYGTPSIIGGK